MAGPITISIIGDNRKLSSSVGDSTGKLRKLGSAGAVVGKALAAGFAVAGAAVVAWGVTSLKSLARIERINAQTAQTIKSTGGAAGVTAKHVENLAGRLENLTATEAESTQEGANLLLTFTNVRNEAGKGNKVFDTATRTLVDMSRALGTDVKGSAIQLGKALNDPVKGISALSRVGVSFTDQQKKQIETMVDAGDTMGAQKVILAELNKEFGGSGKAFAGTTTGKIELAKHAFGTLGETIFAQLLPPLGKIATVAADGLNELATRGPQIQAFFTKLGTDAKPAIDAIAGGFRLIAPIVLDFGQRVLSTVVAGVQSMVPNLIAFGQYAIVLGQSIQTNVIPPVISAARYLSSTFGPIIKQVAILITTKLIPAAIAIGRFMATQVIPVVMRTATAVGKSLKPVFDAVARVIRGDVLPAVNQAAEKFRQWWPTIQKVTMAVLKVTGEVVKFAAKILGVVLPPVIRFAGFLTGTLIRAIVGAIGVIIRIGGAVVDAGQKFINGVQAVGRFVSGVTSKVGDAMRVIIGIPQRITSALSGAGSLLLSEGIAIVQGLISGIISKAGDIVSTITSYVIDKIPGPVRKALGIASPSRVMKLIGQQIVAGIVVGIRGGTKGLTAAMKGVVGTIEATYKKLTDGEKIKPKRLKRIVAGFADELKALKGLAARYTNVSRQLAAARVQLTKVREYGAGLRSAAVEFAKITGAGVVDENGATSAGSITQGLTERLAAIRAFVAKVDQLRKLGLNKTSIDQILAEGIEGGLVTAQAIVAGGAAAVRETNALQGQINAAAASLGTAGQNAMFKGGEKAATGLVKGLETASDKLEAAATRIGRKMNRAIVKALKGVQPPPEKDDDKGKGKGKGGDRKRVVAGERPKISVRDTTGTNRPKLTAAAKEAAAARREPVTVKLTAQQLDQLARGKQIRLDLNADLGAGGKLKT